MSECKYRCSWPHQLSWSTALQGTRLKHWGSMDQIVIIFLSDCFSQDSRHGSLAPTIILVAVVAMIFHLPIASLFLSECSVRNLVVRSKKASILAYTRSSGSLNWILRRAVLIQQLELPCWATTFSQQPDLRSNAVSFISAVLLRALHCLEQCCFEWRSFKLTCKLFFESCIIFCKLICTLVNVLSGQLHFDTSVILTSNMLNLSMIFASIMLEGVRCVSVGALWAIFNKSLTALRVRFAICRFNNESQWIAIISCAKMATDRQAAVVCSIDRCAWCLMVWLCFTMLIVIDWMRQGQATYSNAWATSFAAFKFDTTRICVCCINNKRLHTCAPWLPRLRWKFLRCQHRDFVM